MAKWTLRALRLSRDPSLSQREAARQLGLARGYYCDLENQKRIPSFRTAQLIADFYGVKLDDLEFILDDQSATPDRAEGGR